MDIESVHVYDELIEEILSRLPVKSLLRFRCVSKSWLSLINSERFIKAHRQKSTQDCAFSHHRVMFACWRGEFKQCSLQQLLNEPSSVKPYRIDAPTNNAAYHVDATANNKGYSVVGCCNGLFCLFLYTHGVLAPGILVFWNPATMICTELPNINCSGWSKFGFGWDGTSGAFKVFASTSTGHYLNEIRRGNIYSSKTNSWKEVDYGSRSLSEFVGVFACGKIHWFMEGEDDDHIECFDLETEEFGRIELPTDKIFSELPANEVYWDNLAEIEGCLHLLYRHIDDQKNSGVFGVWVLKESGWFKLFTFPDIRFVKLFREGPNGKILLLLGDNFLVYDGKDGILHQANKDIVKYLNHGCVYVETLVSPNFTKPSSLS